MPFTAHKSIPFAPISPSVYLLRVAHSLLCFPPFIYSLLPRLPFVTPSDSLFPTICLCLTYFRDMLVRASCAQVSYLPYVMHIVSPYLLDSIDYIINVQCFHYSVHYVPLRVFILVCLSLIAAIYLFITSRCLKYAPLDILSLFFTLYSHLSSLTYFRTILLDRDRNFYSTLVLFSQACSDSSPSRFPTVIPSNRPLSTHFPPSYDRPLAAPRFLNLYLSDFYLDP